MKIGILGTGMVGQTIASKLIKLGHEVKMGSRTVNNEKAAEWSKNAGTSASHGTFEDAAKFGELVFNCTSGQGSLEALKSAGKQNLDGKILIDLANSLDFSKGMPPTLSICNDDSLAERIQNLLPDTKVVKTLNTMNCYLMVDATVVPGDHDIFVSGNDENAKTTVTGYLKDWFGWKNPIDLGDITTARGTEMMLPIWLRLYGKFQSPNFNFKIVR